MMTNLRRAFLLGFLLSASTAFAQPATRPTVPELTAEQRAVVNADFNADPTKPNPKHELSAYNKDGTPNPNFGQISPGFLKRHESFMERSKSPAGVVFLGDSITDGWNGQKALWEERFGKYQPANFGIGGDRTQHVLWRIANGELDALQANPPKVAVIMIGTNNIGQSAEQIAAGTTAVVKATQEKLPTTKILLLAIFPRNPSPTSDQRKKLEAANEILAKLDDGAAGKVKFLPIWKQFLAEDGTLTKEIMPDALHPNDKGYHIWADAMGPTLDEMMK